MEMMLSAKVDKTVFNTIVMFRKQYIHATNTVAVREAFDDYIDILYENGRITDNQHQFLELWFVWDTMQNDSNV